MTPPTPIAATAAATPRTADQAVSTPRPTAGEEALRGLLDYLLQSVVQHAEHKIAELVPLILAKELPAHVNKAVREEVERQVAYALSVDRIDTAVRTAVLSELPKQAASQLTRLESTVRQQLEEIAPPLVDQTSEQHLRRLADAGLEKYVPQAVREHLGPVEGVIKNEVREAVARCARQTTEDIVRDLARERIQEAVRMIVPDIAEAQVREEIKRLTAPE